MARKDSHGIVLRTGEYQRPETGKYRFKGKDAHGKPVNLQADTLEELRELEAEALRDKLDRLKTPGKMTINDFYERWKSVKRGVKPNVMSNYCYMYDRFVAPEFGRKQIKTLKRTDVRTFYNSLVDGGKLAINTLEVAHNVFHQIIDLAVNDDYIRYNPAHGALKELKREYENAGLIPEKRALTHEEQVRFTEFIRTSKEYARWYAPFYVLLHTGLRVGELCALQWSDVDFRNNTITVSRTLVDYPDRTGEGTTMRYRMNTAKTRAGIRTIPMSAGVVTAFGIQKHYARKTPCRMEVDGFNDFIFTNRFGDVQHQGTLNKALRERIIRDCNAEAMAKNLPLLPRFSCHTLRHTFCTNLCAAGVDVKTISEIMGHADVRITLEIYTEVTKDMKNRAVKSLEDYLNEDD